MPRAPLTLSGCRLGARLTLPVLPGVVVFGMAFGAAAAAKGLTLAQTMAISTFVFAGASQMVALELWREVWTPAAILGVALVTLTVNARLILMGAALQPWLAHQPFAQNAANLFLLTDANWLIATRARADAGDDVGVLLGSGLVLWGLWAAATLPGYLAGALVPDPRPFGLDVLMPIFFATMLVPLWKGATRALPWAVAGATALAVQAAVPGYAFIVAGALAGAGAGALLDE